MVRIRRFGVIRTATVVAVMYALLVAIIFVPIILLLAVAGTTSTPGLSGVDRGMVGAAGLAGALLIGLVAIIFYGLLGWVFTALACLIYNLAARFVGGIEVQVDRFEAPPSRAAPVGWGAQPPGSVGPPP